MTTHSEHEIRHCCFTPSRGQTFASMLCVILFQLGCSNSEIICESSYTMYDADTEYIPEQDSHTLTIDTFSDTVSHANRMRSFLVEGTLLISNHLDERTFTNTTSIFFSDDASSGEIFSSADYRVEIDIESGEYKRIEEDVRRDATSGRIFSFKGHKWEGECTLPPELKEKLRLKSNS